MRISVLGMGYVGSVTAACLAAQGHDVIGVDVAANKVEMISAGQPPVLEARLGELVRDGFRAGRLRATGQCAEAVAASDLSLVCVGTPSLKNGHLNLSGVEAISRELGQALRHKQGFHTIAVRSTVLPGTIDELVLPTIQAESGKRVGEDFSICYNPEFMREGTAVSDFYTPPFTVIGARNAAEAEPLTALYSFVAAPVLHTEVRVAEMLKYVCNAFHALKIAFANEVGTLAQAVGVDEQELMRLFCCDEKLNISRAYLRPGCAFGGSCLPKDLRAILYRAKQLDIDLPLLESILPSNQQHLERGLDSILSTGKRRIGMLGLSFKAGTDDLRESPYLELVKALLGEGCQVKIYDPQVKLSAIVGSNRQFLEKQIPHVGALLHSSLETVLRESEVIVVGQDSDEWQRVEDLLRPDQTVIWLAQGRAQSQKLARVAATG
jgi:GDP-mannose 6-dehydrogenase